MYTPHHTPPSKACMENQQFGRLTVLQLHSHDVNYNKRWLCQCACGKTKVVLGDKLKNGNTQSCGCYQKEFRSSLVSKADVERRHYTHASYKAMMARCYNPKSPAYKNYGAKGVQVCDRWRFGEESKTGWLCFYEDMGPRADKLSLDRIDNEKGYTPDNCRWATQEQQLANRRRVGRLPKHHPPQISIKILHNLCLKLDTPGQKKTPLVSQRGAMG